MVINILTPTNVDFLIKIALCLAIGFVLGIERELRGKSAGIGTHSLVIAGAMLFTIMATLGAEAAGRGWIATGVVSGIGFIGAGMVFREETKHGERIANLTTASNIWLSAAIGMAIGFSLYFFAIITTIYAVVVPLLHGCIKRKNC